MSIPILQMRRLRLREVDHTVSECQVYLSPAFTKVYHRSTEVQKSP